MTEAEPNTPTARTHRADIGNNVVLANLYIVAIAGLGVGIIVWGIATFEVANAYDPTAAIGWQSVGVLLLQGGFLALVGAMVAHAVNWQIGHSSQHR